MIVIEEGIYHCADCGGQIRTWRQDSVIVRYLHGMCTNAKCKRFNRKFRIPLVGREVEEIKE